MQASGDDVLSANIVMVWHHQMRQHRLQLPRGRHTTFNPIQFAYNVVGSEIIKEIELASP